jgi:hypothetical protein
LIGDKFDLKNVAWLAGVVIVGFLIAQKQLTSIGMGII